MDFYLGDSFQLLTDATQFPDDSFDCVITSPPYFQQREYHGCGIGNEASMQEYLANLLSMFALCLRVIKPTGSIVFNLGDKYDSGNLLLVPHRFAIAVTERFPVRLVNTITWIKSNPTPRQDPSKLISATEPFFVFAKGKNHYINKDAFLADASDDKPGSVTSKYGDKYRQIIDASESLSADEKRNAHVALTLAIDDVRTGVISGIRMKIRGAHAMAYGGQDGGRNRQIVGNGFSIIRLHGKKMKRDVIECPVETIRNNQHPAVFPVGLIEELIRLLSPEDGVLLDPFCGSGTTMLAARNTGRRCIGMEIDPEYHAYAQQRLREPRLVAEELLPMG